MSEPTVDYVELTFFKPVMEGRAHYSPQSVAQKLHDLGEKINIIHAYFPPSCSRKLFNEHLHALHHHLSQLNVNQKKSSSWLLHVLAEGTELMLTHVSTLTNSQLPIEEFQSQVTIILEAYKEQLNPLFELNRQENQQKQECTKILIGLIGAIVGMIVGAFGGIVTGLSGGVVGAFVGNKIGSYTANRFFRQQDAIEKTVKDEVAKVVKHGIQMISEIEAKDLTTEILGY